MKRVLLVSAIATAVVALSYAGQADAAAFIDASDVKKADKPKKITDRSHPDYVRCRNRPTMGSLARKQRICMTNREWVVHNRKGNAQSREFVDDMQSGMNASN
ncbi:MAG: hypothetical protein Pars2KO_13860 [Parasphingorhabdus sp.]